jgi:hypothetical protein
MVHTLAHQALLGRIMASQAGSLDGLAVTRQALWRPARGHLFQNATLWITVQGCVRVYLDNFSK